MRKIIIKQQHLPVLCPNGLFGVLKPPGVVNNGVKPVLVPMFDGVEMFTPAAFVAEKNVFGTLALSKASFCRSEFTIKP